MADPRWRLFWHHDVIVTWCDVITARDVYKKIDFWTYYIFCKFYCDCLNILEVTEGGGGGGIRPPPPPPPPPSEKIQKSPVWIGLRYRFAHSFCGRELGTLAKNGGHKRSYRLRSKLPASLLFRQKKKSVAYTFKLTAEASCGRSFKFLWFFCGNCYLYSA